MFALPAFLVYDDGGFVLLPSDDPFELLGDPPSLAFTVFAADGRKHRPTRVVSTRRTGKRLFGRPFVIAELEWGSPVAYDLAELRDGLRREIESGPDDLYDQERSPEAHVVALIAATSFEAIVEAVYPI